MTDRLRRTTKPILIALALATMAGCGVKNLPVARSGQAPTVVASEQRNGDTTVFGSRQGTAVRVDRISSIQDDNTVSAAEVTRNPRGPKRGFFLDPLLN